MSGPRLQIDAPASFAGKARYTLETLLEACAAPTAETVRYGGSGGLVASEQAWRYFEAGERTPPRLGDGGMIDFGDGRSDLVASAFWHLSRWEERAGSARDGHGRFPAAAALADPARPAVDRLLREFRAHVGDTGRTPFTVALTHDVDIPWRWSRPRALLGAAARARGAARARHPRDAAAEVLGLAAAPVRHLRGTDPNWSYERIAAIERGHGGRSTYFVMAGHHVAADGPDPAAYDRLRPAIVAQIAAQGDEVGLHPSYTASERPRAHRRGAGAAGAADRRRRRRHALPLPAPRAALGPARGRPARLRLRLEPGLRRCDRPAGRVLVPVPALPPGRGPAARPDRAAAGRDGRDPGRGALPGARTGRGARAHAGAARAGRRRGRHVAILWHTDRFSREYARGWDRVYASVLEWIAGRGGRLVTAADAVAV